MTKFKYDLWKDENTRSIKKKLRKYKLVTIINHSHESGWTKSTGCLIVFLVLDRPVTFSVIQLIVV